jgi:hypothetical protein
VLLALASAGCQEKKVPPPEPSEAPGPSSLAVLGIDAGALGEPVDPPAPAGDLKEELDRFVNLDQCVAARAKLDPLVGDALAAIGYETFLRDACRLLEATKDRRRETCDKIDSSALRARCQSWVAIASQTPDACPMQLEGMVTRGRGPSCVAIAARDPRLCAGEPRAASRVTCEALVTRDAARCDALLPAQRPLCAREVARWRSVLSAPLEGLERLPPVRAKLTLRGAKGTPDPLSTEVDLAEDFARGVVVVSGGADRARPFAARTRIELGAVVESESARFAASLQKRPRIGLALIVSPGPNDAQLGALQKVELELPGEAPIVSPPASCDCKIEALRVAASRGGEAAIVLAGTLASGTRSYEVRLDLSTFVRDVAAEPPGGRVLPPLHPPGAVFGRDGGAGIF